MSVAEFTGDETLREVAEHLMQASAHASRTQGNAPAPVAHCDVEAFIYGQRVTIHVVAVVTSAHNTHDS